MYELVQVAENTYYINSPSKIGVYRVSDDDVWLIDSGNDKDAGRKIQKILDAQGWKLTAIINTHYPDHALDISKKSLLLMPGGETVFGDTADVIREDRLEQAFGIPVRIRTIELPERDYTCVMAIDR